MINWHIIHSHQGSARFLTGYLEKTSPDSSSYSVGFCLTDLFSRDYSRLGPINRSTKEPLGTSRCPPVTQQHHKLKE